MLLSVLVVLLSNLVSHKCISSQDVSPDEEFPYGWTLAFRGTSNINKSVYEAYKSGTGIPNTLEAGCKQVDSGVPCSNHYRNTDIFNQWQTVKKVAVVLYERNVKVGYMLFNGQGSDYMNWFNPINLIQSSWTDLKTSETNYFSMEGDVNLNNMIQRFFVNRNYGGCHNDWGWFTAVDTKTPPPCPYGAIQTFPVFLYAKGSKGTNWASGSVGRADVMAVFVK